MSNRGWQGWAARAGHLSCCTCSLQANLPSVVGPAQVLRGPPAGQAGLRRPWRPLASPNTSGVQSEYYCNGYAFVEYLSTTAHLIQLEISAQQISTWCWKSRRPNMALSRKFRCTVVFLIE